MVNPALAFTKADKLTMDEARLLAALLIMGESSYRGVKLMHTPGRENPLADFLSRMNYDQNCPIFNKM